MYYDYNSIYNIIMSTIGLFVSIWFLYLIKKKAKQDDNIDDNDNKGDDQPLDDELDGVSVHETMEIATYPVAEEAHDKNEGDFFAMVLYWMSTFILGIRMIIDSYFFLQQHITHNNSIFESIQIIIQKHCETEEPCY